MCLSHLSELGNDSQLTHPLNLECLNLVCVRLCAHVHVCTCDPIMYNSVAIGTCIVCCKLYLLSLVISCI